MYPNFKFFQCVFGLKRFSEVSKSVHQTKVQNGTEIETVTKTWLIHISLWFIRNELVNHIKLVYRTIVSVYATQSIVKFSRIFSQLCMFHTHTLYVLLDFSFAFWFSFHFASYCGKQKCASFLGKRLKGFIGAMDVVSYCQYIFYFKFKLCV